MIKRTLKCGTGQRHEYRYPLKLLKLQTQAINKIFDKNFKVMDTARQTIKRAFMYQHRVTTSCIRINNGKNTTSFYIYCNNHRCHRSYRITFNHQMLSRSLISKNEFLEIMVSSQESIGFCLHPNVFRSN